MAKSKGDGPANGHVSGQANKPMSKPAHALTYKQVIEELAADTRNGLTTVEANSRLEQYGSNDLGDSEGVQPIKIIIAQVANAMTMVGASRSLRRLYTSLPSPFSSL
jgi:P-type Na+/K+ transporter